MTALLEAQGVSVDYEPARGVVVHAVRDVDLTIEAGEFVGLVGESGCGKSTLGYALACLVRPPARIVGGHVLFDGRDLTTLRGSELRRLRRRGIALVLQAGMNALNPVRTVEHHFVDVLRAHERLSGEDARRRSAVLLERVHLEPSVLGRYPHELSGGMRQRVAIALALALEPRLVVFDEPTTALDVIVQKAVVETILELQRTEGFTAILISHDLGLVLDVTDRVLVMYAGEIVEDQAADRMLLEPRHPYTRALLSCYADPRADEVQIATIPGAPPDLSRLPAGCPYVPRCPLREDVCVALDPALEPVPGSGGAEVAREASRVG